VTLANERMRPLSVISRVAVTTTTVAAALLSTAPAHAASTAQVRIVDRYYHGQVKVWVNRTIHYLGGGHSTGYFAVTPSPSHHDGVSVTSMRYSGCGEGEPGWFFHPGHRYKIVIRTAPPPGGCSENGTTEPAPEFTITKVS
jgi:hypothetical protein